jgi:hypothetical protein
MRELCGTAGEYMDCRTLAYELESGGQEIRFEGGLFKVPGPGTSELGQKHVYRPSA